MGLFESGFNSLMFFVLGRKYWYLGLWKITRESSPMRLYFHMIYKSFVLLMICTFIAALATDLYMSSDNLLIITDDGCILAGLFVILFKLLNFQLYPNELETLLDFVNKNIRNLQDNGNPEHLKIWRSYLLREKVTFYSFVTIGMCLIFALMFLTPTEFGALPIRSKYPFDVTKPPMHQIMFIYQGSVLLISMISILCMDNMVLSLCSQVFCHFDILKINFRECVQVSKTQESTIESCQIDKNCKINEDDKKISMEKKSNNNFIENFSICIKRHQEIINFVQKLDKFSSPLMLVQLMASNVLICLTGFQAILVVGQNSGFMKFAVYLSAAFSQLFYWCWCGNELIYQSTSIAEVLWLTCSWEMEKITSIKSLVTISLMRAKKPLKLTAGKFYVMSMETFISVLSGSYSFFTLLNKMNESVN